MEKEDPTSTLLPPRVVIPYHLVNLTGHILQVRTMSLKINNQMAGWLLFISSVGSCLAKGCHDIGSLEGDIGNSQTRLGEQLLFISSYSGRIQEQLSLTTSVSKI